MLWDFCTIFYVKKKQNYVTTELKDVLFLIINFDFSILHKFKSLKKPLHSVLKYKKNLANNLGVIYLNSLFYDKKLYFNIYNEYVEQLNVTDFIIYCLNFVHLNQDKNELIDFIEMTIEKNKGRK